MQSTDVREEPLLLRKALNWDLLNWSLEDWKNVFSDEKMQFRSGLYQKTAEPQWERSTESFDGTFVSFLKHTLKNIPEEVPNWLYFDYKYLKDCSTKLNKLRNEINWESLGFADIEADDSTIWIGSKGAHTPCHIDTYGYNIVCQLYGRKLWLLFPPDENLQPTRIPYEESSIYSRLNFFSPSHQDFRYFKEYSTCRKIVLNPGDVLKVPHKWWHYVENLDTSISVNVWIPKPQDNEERLKESIVQFFVKQILNIEDNIQFLNPNMGDVILKNSSKSALDIVKQCVSLCRTQNPVNMTKKRKTDSIHGHSIEYYLNTQGIDFELIPTLSKQEFYSFMNQQNDKFTGENANNDKTTTLSSSTNTTTEFLSALTHPEVIELIKNNLLND